MNFIRTSFPRAVTRDPQTIRLHIDVQRLLLAASIGQSGLDPIAKCCHGQTPFISNKALRSEKTTGCLQTKVNSCLAFWSKQVSVVLK